MGRRLCYRCFWPEAHCWCTRIQPMATRTRFVFLMHPKEYKREKAGTGRLTHLSLTRSELHMGIGFDEHRPVQALLADPDKRCFLLYPGPDAVNLSHEPPPTAPGDGRETVLFLLDATWACARKMLKLSPSLQRLPRLMFTPRAPSRYVIKQQPQAGCLSTLECVHEVMLALTAHGLDRYDRPAQLLELFQAMQDFQIRCAADPDRGGYRRQPYASPEERAAAAGESRRRRFLGPLRAKAGGDPQALAGSTTDEVVS